MGGEVLLFSAPLWGVLINGSSWKPGCGKTAISRIGRAVSGASDKDADPPVLVLKRVTDLDSHIMLKGRGG